MNEPATIDINTLASTSDWATALARRLLGDEHLAEDVSQEACLEAVGQREDTRPSRPWLAGVVRNLSVSLLRQRRRRAHWEKLAAEDELAPSSLEVTARFEQQQLLAKAILALKEPYRRTILLRFYENLAPRVIARDEGVSVNTVQSRLTRALAQLRERLDGLHGGQRRAWMVAMVPLARATDSTGLLWLGVLAVNKKITVAIAAVALFGATWITLSNLASERSSMPEQVSAAPSLPGTLDEIEAPDGTPLSDAVDLPAADRTVTASRSDALPATTEGGIEVRVIYAQSGEPAENAMIVVPDYRRRSRALRRMQLQRATMWAEDSRQHWPTLGATYSVSKDGIANVVPPQSNTVFLASDGERIGYQMFDPREPPASVTVSIATLAHVPVQVVDQRGVPLAGVPVALHWVRGDRRLSSVSSTTAGADGEAILSYPPQMVEERSSDWELEAALDFPLLKPVSILLQRGQVVDRPLQLVCPPFGHVLVKVTSNSPQFESDGIAVLRTAIAEGVPSDVSMQAALDGGRVKFSPVGLGLELEASVPMRWDQVPIAVSGHGPSEPGETVEFTVSVDGRIETLLGRMLHADGVPVADEELYGVIVPDESVEYTDHTVDLRTDAQGRFSVELADYDEKPLAGLLRIRPIVSMDPRVPTLVPLPEADSEGNIDLGDIVISRESPLVTGRAVDPEGNPIGRTWVVIVRKSEDADSGPVPGVEEGWEQSRLARIATTEVDGTFEVFGDAIDPGDHITVQSRGALRHHPVPIEAGARDVELVAFRTNSLTGSLLLDEGIPLDRIDVAAWPTSADGRRPWGTRRSTYGQIDEDATFGIHDLAPGEYTVAVGAGITGQTIVIDNVLVQAGGTSSDPRLDPIDLHGRFRAVRLRCLDPEGRPLDCQVFAYHEDESFDQVGHSRRPIVLCLESPIECLLLRAEGYDPLVVSASELSDDVEVQFIRGLPIPLRWASSEDALKAPRFVEVRLTAREELAESSAPRKVRYYLRQWSSSVGRFDTDGDLVLYVPQRGEYFLELSVGENVNGYVEQIKIDGAEPSFVAPADHDEGPALRVRGDADAIAAALRQCEDFRRHIEREHGK